jgi:signal transduction histidine kinase
MPHPEAIELSELIVMMAHDLKNPLAALTTNLHFLQGAEGAREQDAIDALGDSVTLCEVLERFFRNLDILGRRQKLVARRQIVSTFALAHEAVTRARGHAASSGVGIRLEGDVDGTPSVFVDRDLFFRAIENVVANALESAPTGSVVSVTVSGDGAESTITVTDTREAPPPLKALDGGGLAFDASGAGKRLQGLYGRGLALLCADVAARASGARLEIDGEPMACRMRLIAAAAG